MTDKIPAAPNPQDVQPGLPPIVNKTALTLAGAVIAGLWILAAATESLIMVIVAAVLTVVVIGGLVWVYRLARKQRDVLELLQAGAASPEARRQALEQLSAKDAGGKDVLTQLARAQLLAHENPDAALAALEGVDLSKAPGPVADEVRTFRAQMYLFKNRVNEARNLVDDINLSNASNPQSRAMMTAVVAEAWGRSGKHDAALELLADVKLDDPELVQIRPMVLFARVFASFAAGKKERARKDLELLMRQDMNLLGRFVMPGQKVHPELKKIAEEVLRSHPDMRKMARQAQQSPFRRPR